MNGAREFAELFETGQYGKLYIVSGVHARGRTFRIQVLPEGEKANQNGPSNLCLNRNAVTVYGEKGGNPGWTEWYGWLHYGKWQEDFDVLVADAQKQKECQEKKKGEVEVATLRTNQEKEARLLAQY